MFPNKHAVYLHDTQINIYLQIQEELTPHGLLDYQNQMNF